MSSNEKLPVPVSHSFTKSFNIKNILSLFSFQVFLTSNCDLEMHCTRDYVNIKSYLSGFYFSSFSNYD